MSLLAPLYVLGALGIGLPILFHMIRRQPRGQRRFSSLIFLRPTPPTLTRRSRIDNLLLLLIRATALILLAAAFARPFLRTPLLEVDNSTGRRLVVLVDVSASMRRSDLWQQANQVASDVFNELKPADQIAVVSFDSAQRIEWSLEQSATVDANARRDAAAKALQRLQPTWGASNLGDALIFAAELLSTTETSGDGGSSSVGNDNGHIIVISDMQTGDEKNLKSLQAYSWPRSIKTELRTVTPRLLTNAVATILPPNDDDALLKPATGSSNPVGPRKPDDVREQDKPQAAGDDPSPRSLTRIRVSSSKDSTSADFTIAWASKSGERIPGTDLPVHVAPGDSRVVQMPEPPSSVDDTQLTLVLAGDDHDFDNTRYLARPKPMDQQLVFIGPTDGESRSSLSYYLQRTPLSNRRRNVLLQTMLSSAIPSSFDAKQVPLVVVAEAIDEQATKTLKQYISHGGRVLWVLDKNSDVAVSQVALRLIADTPELTISEGQSNGGQNSDGQNSDYAMWSRIDFEHSLFKPMADARYNDFSKIRFWSHRLLSGLSDQWLRVADLDNGDPSIAELSVGEGRLWVLTSGWQPSESQLALSTKFVPLLFGFFGRGENDELDGNNILIGDATTFRSSENARFETADLRQIPYRSTEDFAAIDQPGFYRFVDGGVERTIAVNVDESESRTQRLANDELERYGVVLGASDETVSTLPNQRQQRDVELESRQRIWQWLLVAVLALIGLESWLSGYLDRRQV